MQCLKIDNNVLLRVQLIIYMQRDQCLYKKLRDGMTMPMDQLAVLVDRILEVWKENIWNHVLQFMVDSFVLVQALVSLSTSWDGFHIVQD